MSQPRNIQIDPQAPFLYVPVNDFSKVIGRLGVIYDGQGVKCTNSIQGAYCKFEKYCTDVIPLTDEYININLVDSVGTKQLLKISDKELLIGGNIVGDAINTCYFGVFAQHVVGKETLWTVGNLLLKNYYTVFDMTTADANLGYI